MQTQYFLIGTDSRHHGPLSDDDVRTWLMDGRASRHSRARRAHETSWVPLGGMPEFEEATRPPRLGGSAADGESPQGAATTAPLMDEAVERLDPVSCFRRAWRLMMRDFALLAGWTLGVGIVIMLTSVIPRVGWLVGMVVDNLLMSGLYVLYLARIRGRQPALGDVVAIVRASAMTVVLAGFAQLAMTALGLLLLIVPGIYLAVGYAFVLPLVIDRGMPVWEAMELSRRTVHGQWFQTFGLMLAAGLLLAVSALAFGVGLVLALPLCTAALMFAYEDLFGGR